MILLVGDFWRNNNNAFILSVGCSVTVYVIKDQRTEPWHDFRAPPSQVDSWSTSLFNAIRPVL